jgi:hypothetical protein
VLIYFINFAPSAILSLMIALRGFQKIFSAFCVCFCVFSAKAADRIEFGQVYTTCLSAEFIWHQLDLSLQDSRYSQLWPQDKSQVRGSGLRNAMGQIQVKYEISWLYKPTYYYNVFSNPRSYEFKYEATNDHPFKGGASVRITELNKYQRQLLWQGVYAVDSADSYSAKTFKKFSESFFISFGENLQRLEKTSCSN